MVVTNGDREKQEVRIRLRDSRMVDDSGKEYQCQQMRFGSMDVRPFVLAENTLASGIPTNLVLTFEKVSVKATRIALLELIFRFPRYDGRNGPPVTAQIRNVPITK
jgi:hypothetical protein